MMRIIYWREERRREESGGQSDRIREKGVIFIKCIFPNVVGRAKPRMATTSPPISC